MDVYDMVLSSTSNASILNGNFALDVYDMVLSSTSNLVNIRLVIVLIFTM